MEEEEEEGVEEDNGRIYDLIDNDEEVSSVKDVRRFPNSNNVRTEEDYEVSLSTTVVAAAAAGSDKQVSKQELKRKIFKNCKEVLVDDYRPSLSNSSLRLESLNR